MRHLQILFTGVHHFPQFLDALEYLEKIGEPLTCQFDYQGAGHGSFELLTNQSNKEIEQRLGKLLPDMLLGIEEMEGEKNNECVCAQ